MNSTEDFLFLPTYHQNHLSNGNVNTDNHSHQRTPSPFSSSSSSSASDQDNEFGIDPFYSNLLSTPSDLRELEMLFPDTEPLDTFSELQHEESLIRDEIFSTSSDASEMNIHQFLQEANSPNSMNSTVADAVSPFQIEFNNESFSCNSPSSMFMMQNENSTSSSSSSCVDMDLNFGSINGQYQPLPNTNLITSTGVVTTFVDTFALSPSSSTSMDSPPFSPGDIKVDLTNPAFPQIHFTSNVGAGLAGTNISKAEGITAQSALHSAPKPTKKRGRSASNDNSSDVQALKRHIRMIRNRESASLSRKKKKEYVTALEGRIKDLEKENTCLKKENQLLRSKLQLNGVKLGSPLTSPNGKKKGQAGVLAKVALLGLFGFAMVNFSSHSSHHQDPHSKKSNLSEFSRTMTKLRLSEDSEGNIIPPLMAHQPKFPVSGGDYGDIDFNTTVIRSHLPFETHAQAQHVDGNYSNLSNVSNTNAITSNEVNVTQHYNSKTAAAVSTPTSYLNGTSFNQTSFSQRHNSSYENSDSNWSYPHVKREQGRERPGSRWRSRGIGGGNKNKGMLGWSSGSNSLKSANLVFPPFMGSAGVGNSSNHQAQTRCPNSFNKTESMRVKSDLEDIFGKGKKKHRPKLNHPVKMGDHPIVYSLISRNPDESAPAKAVIPQKKALDVHHGLAVYEGDKKQFSTILDKLERREDTFYVVSLAPDNQLLLSAKASNESSRPKMTLLLPWRNETLKEDMILQIDCEVFQVYHLNEKRQPKRPRA